jgi:MSHA biogenesis protein MshN
MSVINQVLNKIEERGAQSLPGQTMVRAVPPRRDARKIKIALFVLVVVVATFGAAWQWPQIKKLAATATNKAQVKPATVVAASAPVVTKEKALEPPIIAAPRLNSELSAVPPAAVAGESSGTDKSLSQSTKPLLIPHSQPYAADTLAKPSKVPNEKPARNKVEGSPVRTAVPADKAALPMKQISIAQQADAEFQKASGLAQQGSVADALVGYEAALRLNPAHDAARQAWVALLLENKRGAEAERVLQAGIKSRPEQPSFAMLLARLQVERGAIGEALVTLEKSMPFAEQQPDYQAFLAALLQRQDRHNEAIAHYQVVLQHVPDNGIWLMGYGISLQAVQRNAEAKEAFKRSLSTQMLSPELREFVQQKLKGL